MHDKDIKCDKCGQSLPEAKHENAMEARLQAMYTKSGFTKEKIAFIKGISRGVTSYVGKRNDPAAINYRNEAALKQLGITNKLT